MSMSQKIIDPSALNIQDKNDESITRTVNITNYTRRQINKDRMIFGDFSVNSEPIFLKFCKGHFLFKF